MKQLTSIVCLAILLISCKTETKKVIDNQTEVKSDEWIHLFDGTSTDGWRAYNGEVLPPQWIIENGILTFDTERKLESVIVVYFII